MLEKILKIAIAFAAIFIVSYFVYTQFFKPANIPQYQDGKVFPAFEFLKIDGQQFTNKDVPENQPVVVTFFNPGCSHCQVLANGIRSQMHQLKDVTFVYITDMEMDIIQEFAKSYGLLDFKNVHFLQDLEGKFYYAFGEQFVPLIFVYDENHQRIKRYTENCKVEDLLKDLGKSF